MLDIFLIVLKNWQSARNNNDSNNGGDKSNIRRSSTWNCYLMYRLDITRQILIFFVVFCDIHFLYALHKSEKDYIYVLYSLFNRVRATMRLKLSAEQCKFMR